VRPNYGRTHHVYILGTHNPKRLYESNGHTLADQELSLLLLFNQHGTPASCLNGNPVDLLQIFFTAIECSKAVAGISVGECPRDLLFICPTDYCLCITFKMYDWLLTVAILHLRMVTLVENVQHDGPWAEVKGNILAYSRALVTGYGKLHSSVFDLSHAYKRT
jgi:hypothetical protein